MSRATATQRVPAAAPEPASDSGADVSPLFENLPAGWTITTLGAVVLKKVEQEEPAGTGTFYYIDIGSVDNVGKIITEAKRLPVAEASSRARQKVRAGDVLVSMTRPNLNAVAVVRTELDGATASTGFDVLRPTDAVLTEWLFLHVRSQRFVAAMTALVQGALYPAVRPSDIRNFAIPLPPLPEQRRIVARLEALEARSRRARDKLAAVPAQLAQARQSLLAAAFRGNLTADWRRDANNAEWRTGTIDDICTESFYGPRFSDKDYTPHGIPTIRTTDFTDDGSIQLRETPRVVVPADRRAKFLLRPGDLLVTRTGSIGKMAIFRGGYDALHSAYLIRFRFNQAVTPDFVFNCLSSPRWQSLLGLSTTAVTQPNVNAEAIRRLPIPLPSIDEQHEIVRRLNAAFAKLDAAARAHAAAVAALDRLDQSLLARAFSGRLVVQEATPRLAKPPASAVVQCQTYLLRFIPTLLREADHPVSLDDLNRVVALRFLPAGELLPVVERLGGAEARAHFAASNVAYEDGAFLAAMRLLRRNEAITVATDRHGIQTLSLGRKPPPSTLDIDADARHLAPLCGRVPAKCVMPTLRRLQSVEVREALLATP